MTNGEIIQLSVHENTTTLNLQDFVCSVCGEDHETENCSVTQNLTLVQDSEILSRARLTLPKNLKVKTLADGTTTVVTDVRIEQGTQFGPFQAPLSLDMHPAISFPLKVFGKTSGDGYYLDTTDEESCNWMCLVETATTTREQNLICYDVKQNIYFTTVRDVLPGEELRVWYALYYGLKLQALPLADDSTQEVGFFDLADEEVEERLKSSSEASVVFGEDLLQTLAQHLPAHALGASGERDVWICKLCGGEESNVASYARHLMNHYRQQVNRHLQCRICLKRFYGKKVLEKHMSKSHSCEMAQNLSPTSMASGQNMQFIETSRPPGEKDSIDERSVCCKTEELTERAISSVFVGGQSSVDIKLQIDWSTNESQNQSQDSISDFSRSENYGNQGSCLENVETHLTTDISIGQQLSMPEISSKLESYGKTSSLADSNFSICNDAPCSELSQSSSLVDNDCKQIKLSTDVEAFNFPGEQTEEQTVNLHPQLGEPFIINSNSESSLSSFDFGRTQTINVALESGEPITFIMVNPSDRDEVPIQCVHGNISFSDDSLLQSSTNESSGLIQEDSIASCPNPDYKSTQDRKSSYNCDICHKSFEKCSYLYRHLRKHTGEFTCVSCLAVFARKENLKAHSCSQPKEWHPCPTCGKKFSAKKYLQRHIPIHTGEFTCLDCKRCFVSRLSLKVHRCPGSKATTERAVISCFMCEQVFDTELKLQSHLKVHSDASTYLSKPSVRKSRLLQKQGCRKVKAVNPEVDQNEASEKKVFICEICGALFRSSSSMKTHRFLHGERKFECEICKKRFHRKDVLQEHLTVHQEPNFPCQICGKKYKTKKSLYVHTLIHKGSKRFACGECGKEFFQKGNLFKHVQTHTTERLFACSYCSKSFTSKEYFNIHELTHTQGKIFSCDTCKKSFVKKHMLDSHRQLFHSNRGYLCKFCNSVIRHKHSVRRHLELRHSEHREEWSVQGFIDLLLAELPQSLVQLAGDARLTPTQQQERQQLLESLRNTHFQSKMLTLTASVESESTSDFVYSPGSSSEQQISHLAQGDPLIMLQSSQQLTFIDNFLPDYDQAQLSTHAGHSLMVSGEARDGEILFTLVDQEALKDNSIKSSTPVLTSAVLGSDIIGLDSGTTFMMEEGSSSNGVLLYVVETSNDEGDSEDLVWCNDAVSEQL